ncbi:hypothetical protein ONZ43_g5627 [Nemania bipapillata]|uniref:Uncharacterized protein n=1 Tax=Nemania bipapillata TaxID=110536 RepID=A0ACC2I8D1_9PEZI|nr:hypothetical protein ONZ43_g5627 [Nemania bipapillata]
MEEWKNIASRSNELLEKLDFIAQQAGDSIRNYLEKYDQHLKATASDHLDTLREKLEGNLELWNKEIRKKGEFEERLLQEYSNGMGWYQQEIQQLQGEKLNRETVLEQLRMEFLNERQRLSDEHNEQLISKAIEYSRLAEKQRQKQERRMNWHIRNTDEKNSQWQERVAAIQEEHARLIRMRAEEQVEHQKESQKASQQIWNLSSDLGKIKQELDTVEKLNEELKRKGLEELERKSKDYLEEIEQLRETNKDLREQFNDSEIRHKKSEQELTDYRKMLEEALQDAHQLQKSHDSEITQLKADLARDKALLEGEHRKQARADREKLEGLEQLVESLRKSKHERDEEHYKALEEINRKWQKELDQSLELVREAKASRYLQDAEIEALQQKVNSAQSRVQSLTDELGQMEETHQSAFDAQEKLELSKQEVEKSLDNLQRAFQDAESEKKSLGEQVAQLATRIQNTTKENESLETSLKTTRDKLTEKTREVVTASKEVQEGKQRLTYLQSQLDQIQKQETDSQSQIKQKDAQIEKLKLSLRQERNRREELSTTHKADREGNERKITELTAQLTAKVKYLKEVESAHNTRQQYSETSMSCRKP